MKATEVMEVLRAYVAGRNSKKIAVEELRMGSGYGAAQMRRIDLWVIDPGPATGCRSASYEVKVSRSDFLGEVRQPNKQRSARLFADEFWYVTPEGLITPDEVPDWAGLMEIVEQPEGKRHGRKVGDKWYKLVTVCPAPVLSKHAPSWPLVVSLLRRVPLVRELWRHKKGGLYEMVGEGRHSETQERLTAYLGEDGELWFRPVEMFHDGRFTQEAEPGEAAERDDARELTWVEACAEAGVDERDLPDDQRELLEHVFGCGAMWGMK